MLSMKIATIIAFAMIAMPGQNQTPSQNQTKSPRYEVPTAPSINYDNQSTHYKDKDSDKPQGWHKFVTWPEGIGTWAVLATLLVISIQSYWTAVAASSASKNVEAVMNTERGFVLIDWDDVGCLYEPPTPVEEWRPCLFWNARNTGKSPVFLIERCVSFVALKDMADLPDIPVYPAPVSIQDEPVIPDKKSDPFWEELKTDLPFLEIEPAYRSGRIVLYAYGYVRYHDIYKREHVTRFGLQYFAAPHPRHEYDRFRMGGPPKYNEYT